MIYENDRVFAFLDIKPNNPGHTLVIPKMHYKNIYETPSAVFMDVMDVVRQLSVSIKKAVGADGINLHMNNDAAAGQLVFHAHVHIIPRFIEDGYEHWHGHAYEEGEMHRVGEKIRSQLIQ